MSYTAGTQSPFGYAGQYQGTSANATGFENMQARWYDSETGSFTTRDPAFSQTDQAYVYAEDDPVNETDPSGLYAYVEHELIGPVASGDEHVGTAQQVMEAMKKYVHLVFPFPITGCGASLTDGASCLLHAASVYGSPLAIDFPNCFVQRVDQGCGQVTVGDWTPTSFDFTVTGHGYFDAPGAYHWFLDV